MAIHRLPIPSGLLDVEDEMISGLHSQPVSLAAAAGISQLGRLPFGGGALTTSIGSISPRSSGRGRHPSSRTTAQGTTTDASMRKQASADDITKVVAPGAMHISNTSATSAESGLDSTSAAMTDVSVSGQRSLLDNNNVGSGMFSRLSSWVYGR